MVGFFKIMENEKIQSVAELIIRAGQKIIEVYESADFNIEYKGDDSPLTRADSESHRVIQAGLERLFVNGKNLPVLSEEGCNTPFEERRDWNLFWLVDPLDGTKEFIKRNGEFTVNIALIENGTPTAGFVYIPVTDILYFGNNGLGSFRLDNAVSSVGSGVIDKAARLEPSEGTGMVRVVASRSHLSEETEAYIESLKSRYGRVDIVSSGSSIKLCMVADGSADVYPRFAPTMEWDTAAAHAVCKYAGVGVIDINTKKELNYNKENLLNPWFLVYKNEDFANLISQ